MMSIVPFYGRLHAQIHHKPAHDTVVAGITFQSFPRNFSYNGIRCILRDHKGYMWFGTSDGLIKFDGVHLYEYKNILNDSTSISRNAINAIVEDQHKNLWIATSRGLNLYNREQNNFIRIGVSNPELARLKDNYVRSLCIDNDTNLWIGTFGDGLNVYNHYKKTLLHYQYDTTRANAFSSNRITSLCLDDKSRIWIGTLDGLYLFLGVNNGFRHFVHQKGNPESLSNNIITVLLIDNNKNLWIGTRGGGVSKLMEDKGSFLFKRYTHTTQRKGLSNNIVLSLASGSNGILWIGTENGGLNRLHPDGKRIDVFKMEEGNEFSLNSNSIWSLHADIEGRLWIGNGFKGINIIDDNFNKFESYRKNIINKNSLPDNDVKDFYEDQHGYIWIATDGGGVCRFDPKTRTFSSFIVNTEKNTPLSNNEVQAVLCDKKGNIWVGTWAGGVDLFNPKGEKVKNYKTENNEGGGNNNVIDLVEDSKGRIWACSGGSGLFRYDNRKDIFVQIIGNNPTTTLSSSAHITSFLEDKENNYWVGALNGIEILEELADGSFNNVDFFGTIITSNKALLSLSVEDIFIDNKDRIWICTNNNGLVLYNKSDNNLKVYQKSDGLPTNTLLNMQQDKEGNLWVTTNKGLSKFNPENETFENYTTDDGLNSNEFYSNSFLKTGKGEFYMGGEEGFNTFYPGNIKQNQFIPPVYLSSLKINNVPVDVGEKGSVLTRHISETHEIVLLHNQSSFTLEFAALNYTRPAKNQYAFKLEGFDENWNYNGNGNTAIYTNIKPGKYVFKVKGSNNDGGWNNTPTKLFITIKPPAWKTWWAYSLYVIIITFLVLLSTRIWKERLRIKNELRLEQMAHEKEHELHETNIQFFTNISHEFRTPLSLILGPLESLVRNSSSSFKDTLLVIYRNAQRLLHLTNDLMDLRKLEEGKASLKVGKGDIAGFLQNVSSYFNANAKRRDISFQVHVGSEKLDGFVDFEKLETIVLNLLSNAFKHVSDNGKVFLNLEVLSTAKVQNLYGTELLPEKYEGDYIRIEVADNGPGIKEEDLPFVFDKFFQSKKQKRKKASGTGIGLTLTRGLVELHHGSISADSIPDKETSFRFVLPIDKSAFNDDELMGEQDGIVTTSTYLMPEDSGVPNDIQRAKEEEKPDLLIVEDNHELRSFLVKELSVTYNVLQAENGKQGIALALEKIPDLIVSDIIMPNGSGDELCKTLKTNVKTSHIPIILLSAKSTVDDQIEGAEIGADAYMTKPFNMQLLFARIVQLIESRHKLYARFSQDVYIMPNKITENKIDQKFLQKAMDYILVNLSDNNLNVEGLADAMNLSRSNVYRKIKALTGRTIVDFIRTIRMKEAVKLMESKKFTLAEIAYQTGFTSPSYFTKSFKDFYGKPPSEYL